MFNWIMDFVLQNGHGRRCSTRSSICILRLGRTILKVRLDRNQKGGEKNGACRIVSLFFAANTAVEGGQIWRGKRMIAKERRIVSAGKDYPENGRLRSFVIAQITLFGRDITNIKQTHFVFVPINRVRRAKQGFSDLRFQNAKQILR